MRFRLHELTLRRLYEALARRVADVPDRLAWWLPTGRSRENGRRLRRFADAHPGDRCFILGNGPSLARTDLALLRNEVTFGANRVYLLQEQIGFSPSYYVCSNELVLEQFAADIARLPMPKFLNWNRRSLFPADRDDLMFFRLRLEVADRFRSPRAGLSSGGTVTFVAMQLAFYMGFRDVVLLGVDHDFVDKGTPNRTAVRTAARDDNHFHPDYFPRGSKWQLPDLLRSEVSYALARRAFERAGGRIVDATLDGKCPVFERMDLASALARPRPVPPAD